MHDSRSGYALEAYATGPKEKIVDLKLRDGLAFVSGITAGIGYAIAESLGRDRRGIIPWTI